MIIFIRILQAFFRLFLPKKDTTNMFKVILQEFYSNLVILCRGVTLDHVIFTILRRVFVRVEGWGEGGLRMAMAISLLQRTKSPLTFFITGLIMCKSF